jgi:hypothetical protein
MDRLANRQNPDRSCGLAGEATHALRCQDSGRPRNDGMDRFINQQNIDRYRRLASEATSATDRLRIMKLLAEEEAKFKLEFNMPGTKAPRAV